MTESALGQGEPRPIPAPAESFHIPADPQRVIDLDETLKDFVGGIKFACDRSLVLVDIDPTTSTNAILDAGDTLNLVMDGDIEKWIE